MRSKPAYADRPELNARRNFMETVQIYSYTERMNIAIAKSDNRAIFAVASENSCILSTDLRSPVQRD